MAQTKENISTILLLEDASELDGSEVIYLLQGTGSDRDRKITLANLLKSGIVKFGKVYAGTNDEQEGVQGPLTLVEQFNRTQNITSRFGDVFATEIITQSGYKVKLEIINGAVTTDKIADKAVDGSKLAAGAIDSEDLIAKNVINDDHIQGLVIGAEHLKPGAVTSDKIANDAITSDKIYSGAVGTTKIANGAIGEGKLANNAVTTDKIKDGAVTGDKIASDAKTSVASIKATSFTIGSFIDLYYQSDKTKDLTNYCPEGTEEGTIVAIYNGSDVAHSVTFINGQTVSLPAYSTKLFMYTGTNGTGTNGTSTDHPYRWSPIGGY